MAFPCLRMFGIEDRLIKAQQPLRLFAGRPFMCVVSTGIAQFFAHLRVAYQLDDFVRKHAHLFRRNPYAQAFAQYVARS